MVRQRAAPQAGANPSHALGRLLVTLVVFLSSCASTADSAPSRGTTTAAPQSSVPFFTVLLNTHDPVTADLGFTAVDVTPSQVQLLARNRRGLVWLGGYDRTTCTLVTSDAELRRQFSTFGLAGDPRVLGYFIADEPNTDHNCPQSVGQLRERTALVHSLDATPQRFTLANVDDPAEFAAFKDTVDVLATDPYPCRMGRPCDTKLIPDRVASLRRAGVKRYVAILQAFQGTGWRWPSAQELQQMLGQWRRSDWCGALVFSWTWAGNDLADHPDLLAVLKAFDAHLPTAPRTCS